MDGELLLSQLINGLGNGLIYFLIAVGFTLVFGLMNFVNFAHGAFFLLGSYAAMELTSRGLSLFAALLIAPLLVGAVAFVAERVLFRRLYGQDHMYQIVATLAVAILVQEVVTIIWGPFTFTLAPPELLAHVVRVGPIFYPAYRVFVVVAAAVIAVILFALLERTRLGATLRAGSEDAAVVASLGINVKQLFTWTFAGAAGLAALAGVLSTPMRSITPVSGTEVLVLAVVVVVVGTLGSYVGTLLAAIGIAEVQSIAVAVAPAYGNLVIYVLMAGVLLTRSEKVLALVGRQP